MNQLLLGNPKAEFQKPTRPAATGAEHGECDDASARREEIRMTNGLRDQTFFGGSRSTRIMGNDAGFAHSTNAVEKKGFPCGCPERDKWLPESL